MFINSNELEKIKIYSNLSIKESVEILEKERKGIIIIVNKNDEILGTVTDGDIRRSILKGVALDDFVKEIMNTAPITSSSIDVQELSKLSTESNLECIPIMDRANRLIGLFSLTISSEQTKPRYNQKDETYNLRQT